MDDVDENEVRERAKRSERRARLFELISEILSGKFDSEEKLYQDIFNQLPPRYPYISPNDRATYNYGYTDNYIASIPFNGE